MLLDLLKRKIFTRSLFTLMTLENKTEDGWIYFRRLDPDTKKVLPRIPF